VVVRWKTTQQKKFHHMDRRRRQQKRTKRKRERENQPNWTRSGNPIRFKSKTFYNSRRRQKKVRRKQSTTTFATRARATKKTTAPRTSPFAVDAAHPIFIYATMRVVRIIMHVFPNTQPLFLTTTPSSFTDFFYLGFWACVCLFVLWVSLDFLVFF